MSADLTAVLVMPRGFEELAESVRHIQRQGRPERIEIVLVHTRAHAPIDPAPFARFRRFATVALETVPTVAHAFAAALPHATGGVVALVEDHVLLDEGWAEAVLAAHAQPSAAVAPHMANANPGTATSWANFLASFSEAAAPRDAGPVDAGPGHNTSYKRAVLERYRDELLALYQSERTFHYRLRRDGHVILHAPAARLRHLNISIPWQAIRHAFLGGVVFGAYRSRGMRAAERAARTALAPLVPPLRLWRTRRLFIGTTARVPRSAWAFLPVLLVAHAAGEVGGYWRIVPDVEMRYEHFELHRLECLRAEERTLMTGARTGA